MADQRRPVDTNGRREQSVRRRLYRGGRQLVGRQLVGSALRLITVLAVTRMIGPTDYGYYAAAAVIVGILSTVATFGIDVDLVRVPEVEPRAEHVAFTLVTTAALTLGLLTVLAAPLYGYWINDPEAVTPIRVVGVFLPLAVIPVAARSRLERSFEFGSVAILELIADLVVLGTALPLALAGAGVWAPLGGLGARLLWLAVAMPVAAGLRPTVAWDREQVRAFAHFGSRYSAGRWMTVASNLVNPLLVGRLVGPAGVAHVAIASRMIEQLGAVKQVAVRLATPALARVRDQPMRLRAAHAEGSLMQVLGAVPFYAAAAFAAPWAVPLVLGSAWTPAVEVLALLAMAAAVGAAFNLHAPVLHVVDRPSDVARVRVWQFVALAVGTVTFVPQFGVAGYGAARLGRSLPFALMHHKLKVVFTPDYRPTARWLAGLMPMMLSPWVPSMWRLVLLAPLAVVLTVPNSRSELATAARRLVGRDQS